jgi:putative chitinase
MINRQKFFAGIRQQPFSGKLTTGQVSGTSAILDEWERRKQLSDLRWLAYMLATTKWETDHTMQPIKEGGGLAYLKSKRYYPWYGRGYVQLTWDYNYKKMTKLLQAAGFKTDLMANPELALDPDVAAFVMFEGMIGGVFTGKKLADYFSKDKTDWLNARRIINGTDKAAEIAAIAKAFFTDLSIAA